MSYDPTSLVKWKVREAPGLPSLPDTDAGTRPPWNSIFKTGHRQCAHVTAIARRRSNRTRTHDLLDFNGGCSNDAERSEVLERGTGRASASAVFDGTWRELFA